MHFFKLAALAMSLSMALPLAKGDSNDCSSATTVFVTVTANPVTTTVTVPVTTTVTRTANTTATSVTTTVTVPVSTTVTVRMTITPSPVTTTVTIPFEVLASKTGINGVLSKLQQLVDTAKHITPTSAEDITLTSTEHITLVHVVTDSNSVPSSSVTVSNSLPSKLQQAADTSKNITTSTKIITLVRPVTSVVTIVATTSTPALATVQPSPPSSRVLSDLTGYPNDSHTTIKVFETKTVTETVSAVDSLPAVAVSSFGSVSSTNALHIAATTSLVTITLSKPFTGLNLSGWNTTLTALLKGDRLQTGDKTIVISKQTGVGDKLLIRPGTAVTPLASGVFNVTVPSASVSAITTPSSKPFAKMGLKGLNATLTTLLKEKLLKTTNEPAKRLSLQTGAKGNLATRSGNCSLPAAVSSFNGPIYYIGARQLGSSSVTTIETDAASLTSNYDGAALTTPAPVVIPSDAASNLDQTVTSTRHGHRLDKSCKSSNTSLDISSQQSLAPTDFQSTSVLSLSSPQRHGPATNTTSLAPTIVVFAASSTAASTTDLSNSSSVSKSAVTATNSCNGTANFTLNFDDLPQSPTSAESPVTPTIVNPYRKLFFEGHYRYVQPPSDPFPPVSPPLLAQYRVDQTVNAGGPADSNRELVGEFGAGPRSSDGAYWIDAFSLWLGCQNAGPSNCVITINGYGSTHSASVVSTTIIQPPCPGLSDCTLAFVEFPRDFRNLAGIQILATVDQTLTTFYVDDVSLGWSDNTCAAQAKRASAP